MAWQVRDFLTGGLLLEDCFSVCDHFVEFGEFRRIQTVERLCIIYVL